MISTHDLVTCCLVYLSVGFGIWLVLDGLGVISNSFAEKRSASRALVLATLMMIMGWPVFIYLWLKGMMRPAR